MAALLSIVLVTLIACGPLPGALNDDHADAPVALEAGSTETPPLTPVHARTVAEALELFETAGLELPTDLAVRFPDDRAGCGGDLGRYEILAGIPTVSVCWTHDDPDVQWRLQLQALVHELAHAWEAAEVDQATRQAFEDFTGASSWAHTDSAWTDRGQELAAELVTWAVLDPAVLFIDFEQLGDCARWPEAFALLTDLPAPAHLVRECDPGR